MPSAIIFDDGRSSLGPLTDLRASFSIRTGALTTVERVAMLLESRGVAVVEAVWTPEHLVALTRESTSGPVNDLSSLKDDGEGVLLINGRCPVPPDGLDELESGEAIVSNGAIVAARLPLDQCEAFLRDPAAPRDFEIIETQDAWLLEFPWDVIAMRDDALDIDLELLSGGEAQALPDGVIAIEDERLFISPEALVYPSVVLDASQGPIVIDDHATIRPGAIIIGPAYIGVGSTILDRALIKAHTAVGPVCKVAGEVGGTIFQGFANKGHDGHLGDSWVGQWANLGAGTTNSNLLNTYGEVIAQAAPDARRIKTGLTFLGCIIGDHVKTAIMTRIMTGSVFGTGSMIAAATPPTTIGRFEWVTDEPGAGVKRQPYRFEKFLEVARAAMARRKAEPSEALITRLRSLCG